MEQTGPVLVCVKTVPNIRDSRDAIPPAGAEAVTGKPRAIANLLAEFGKVLSPNRTERNCSDLRGL